MDIDRLGTRIPGALLKGAGTIAVISCIGCSSAGPSVQDAVTRGVPVETFVESKFSHGLLPTNRTERPQGPGEVIYDASFNAINFEQLTEPARLLGEFCRLSGGTYAQLAPSRVSAALLARPAVAPSDFFVARQEAYRSLGLADQTATLGAAFDTQFYASAIRGQYPQAIRDTLAGVEGAGAFGQFECQRQTKPLWIALVEPVKYNPSPDPGNKLRTPTLTVYVKGLTLGTH